MSQLFKASLLLAFFFGLNKIVALIRQIIIARQFGLTADIDAFNVANNYPDLIVSLISAGAISFAFIPVLSEYKQNFGLKQSWKLFSNIANLVFLTTIFLSALIAVFAEVLVSSKFGIAPGFNIAQQNLTVNLMRLNLLSAIVFSLSSLIMATLHTHKHFLLPAVAPILYNLGQIFGAVILSPSMGVYGLSYGVILGAILHMSIQIPALVIFRFKWSFVLDFKDTYVQKVLNLMAPRFITVLLINFIFIARDNLASRLEVGAVSALTYAYFIMQVPQTLIGTAIGTALLPTLSELTTPQKISEFEATLNRTVRVIIATTLVTAILISIGLGVLIKVVFNFDDLQTKLMVGATIAYLIGLVGHSLLEVASRAFYARQNAKIPLFATIFRAVLFIMLALSTFESFGVIGIAMADSISVSLEVVLLLMLLSRSLPGILNLQDTIVRTVLGCISGTVVMVAILYFLPGPALLLVSLGGILGGLVHLIFIKKELKLLIRL